MNKVLIFAFALIALSLTVSAAFSFTKSAYSQNYQWSPARLGPPKSAWSCSINVQQMPQNSKQTPSIRCFKDGSPAACPFPPHCVVHPASSNMRCSDAPRVTLSSGSSTGSHDFSVSYFYTVPCPRLSEERVCTEGFLCSAKVSVT